MYIQQNIDYPDESEIKCVDDTVNQQNKQPQRVRFNNSIISLLYSSMFLLIMTSYQF